MSTRPKSTQRVKSQTVTLNTTESDSSSKNTPHTNSQRRVRPKTVPAKTQSENVKSSHLSTEIKSRIGNGQYNPDRKPTRDRNNGVTTGTSTTKVFTKRVVNVNQKTAGAGPRASDVDTGGHTETEKRVVNGNQKTAGAGPRASDVDTGGHTETEKRVVNGNKKTAGAGPRASDVDTGGHTETEKLNVTGNQSSLSSQKTSSNEESEYSTKHGQSPDRSSYSSSNGSDKVKVNENHREENVEEHIIENVFDGRYFSCSVDSDVTTPWLVGLAYVRSGDVICLDLNNERIKRFDKNFKMVSSIEVPFDCSGMTITSPDEVAVTCLNEIHFYNVGKFGMNRTARYITVNGMAHGIAHDQNWFAVTCDITEPEASTIRVIDETGSEQYIIDPSIVSGLPLKFASFLTLDKSLDRIFISDSAPSRVVCINFRGEPLWDTSIPGGSRDIVSVNVDNILVCDQFSEKIRLLTKDGVLKSDVISAEDGLCNPDIVARRPGSNDVIVSYGGFGTVGLFSVQL
ncbi:uncharacterized protein LOC125662729 [Ostrea edulis]|uniref:uncharacterized protein LOC125662729 n=1 Tax=Ostrea edulis TaxID=37623 RepID=UPI0024AEF0C0|nr:uncharacterized protein LOC125662729 [Ostrea edulis]XP_048751014.2 uncharacterized protein LOC125662729 [Ostrea edulis]